MEMKTIDLINGSRLAVVNIPQSLVVTTMALVKAGPRYDPLDKTGLSHFTEHILLKGSKKWPTRFEMTSALEKRGASDYSFTYYEANTYWAKSVVSDLDLAIESIVDRLENPLLKEEDIETEKGVVREERQILDSNPDKLIWELWSETIWRGTSLGRYYIGGIDEINSFTQKDVSLFKDKFYLPQRTIYTVCGNVEPERTVTIFNKFLKKNKELRRITLEKDRLSLISAKKNIKLIKKKTENVNIAIGFPTIPFGHEDGFVLDLVASLLAGGMSSRLRQKIMEAGLTYAVNAYTQYLSDTGYLVVILTTGKQNLNSVLGIIKSEFSDLSNNLMNDGELDIAKGYLIGNLSVNMETTYDWAKWYAGQLLYTPLDIKSPEMEVEKILQINPSTVQKAAKKYLNPGNIYLSAIGDIQEKEIKMH